MFDLFEITVSSNPETEEKLLKLEKAAEFLQARGFGGQEMSMVLGSGLGGLVKEATEAQFIDAADIPGYPQSTVEGHRGRLAAGKISGTKTLIFQGRMHFYEGYGPLEVCAPVIISRLLDIESLILTTAAGAVNPAFHPGEMMIIDDYITIGLPESLTGFHQRRSVECGCRASYPVSDNNLAQAAAKAALEAGIRLHRGVFGYALGPCYETPAEVRMLEFAGVDAVSMSTAPEIAAAKLWGLKTLALAFLANRASGFHHAPLTHDEVQSSGAEFESRFRVMMRKMLEMI